jgi:hypothetical protein
MKYAINGDLSSKEIAGELFIYNRKNSTIYTFNGTGVRIWALLKEGVAFDELSWRLCEEYDVSPAEADADVSAFVKNLRDNGLITGHPG